ncbi:MBL fold metallo-hydrolase [Candidatus Kuenenia sp.]|uniref:MBL fold metallo-hydrolase n=1 Tax=Candidatus Kuenenia sp. TaxID=2499824 RepID=UPI003220643C
MTVGIKVKFWGVRGSIPIPGVKTTKYGGNTACVEVRFPNCLFIFDAGTGIKELGNQLCAEGNKVKAHIFLSHFHWDHIQGLPFFKPAYLKGNEIIIYGMGLQGERLEHIISNQMESVYFPVRLQSLQAKIKFKKLWEGNYVIDGIKVDTLYINHPGRAMGYVITYENKKICYFTDNEIVPIPLWTDEAYKYEYKQDIIEKMLQLIEGADLLIHDAQYTNQEYQHKVGWGHSSIPEVLSLALQGRVKKLALFHHDPESFDEHIDAHIKNCVELLDDQYDMECFAALEGMEICL